VIRSNLGFISHGFRDTATHSLKLSITNCGQTAEDKDMVTTDSLQKVDSTLIAAILDFIFVQYFGMPVCSGGCKGGGESGRSPTDWMHLKIGEKFAQKCIIFA